VTTATASWGAASDNVGVTAYRYRVNGGAWSAEIGGTSVGLSGLSSYTTYTVEVQARDAVGNWGGSSSNSFTTVDGTPPSAPGAPSFSSIGVTTATASWGAASDNVGVTAYRYRVNSGAWSSEIGVTSVGLSGLSSYTTYTVEVQARDAVGNWGGTSSNSFTTVDGTPPSAPGSLNFSSVTSSSAFAQWSNATDNVGVTGFQYRLNSGAWVDVGYSFGLTLSGLTASTTYSMDVQARDAAGNWGPSVTNSFTTTSSSFTDVGTMTIGRRGNNALQLNEDGFRSSPSPILGSYAPTALTGGKTLLAFFEWVDYWPGNPQYTRISVSGFSSDPGQSWLISAAAGVSIVYGSQASATYSYFGGVATWDWPIALFLGGTGTMTQATIVHQ
jgi:chitodextrinase